jgi:putative transposase
VSQDLDVWAYQRGVTLDFSRPGKPTDNVLIEAFSGRFPKECLNSLWRKYNNDERSHGAVGDKLPILLRKHAGVPSPPP